MAELDVMVNRLFSVCDKVCLLSLCFPPDDHIYMSFAGQVLSFENLVYSIFDFVTVLVETPKFRNSVRQGLDDLVYYVIVYGQITEDQVNRLKLIETAPNIAFFNMPL